MENTVICYCKQCIHCSYDGCDMDIILITDSVCQYFEPRDE